MNSETIPCVLVGEGPEIRADRLAALMRYQARVFGWTFSDYVKVVGPADAEFLNTLAIIFTTAIMTCARSEFPDKGDTLIHMDELTVEEFQAVRLLADLKNTYQGVV